LPPAPPPACTKYQSGIGGTVGVTLLDAALAGLVPAAFVAVTVKVKAVSLVKPVTIIGEVVLEADILVFDVAVKLVIVAGKPRFAGAVKVIVAIVLPAVAVPIVGAPGALGHSVAAFACICCVLVQIPYDVTEAGGVAEITPPL